MPEGPIFVVHGHARAALHETVRVLERGTGREVIVLHEQASAGRTIVEKFEDYAADVSFAVVLLTGDDEGGMRASSEVHPRGRQNVIFELGFFSGNSDASELSCFFKENIERPSDIAGLVYINLDQSGAWKYSLARELEAAGITVDRARIP
jgi:predicted nucleotide-binding protein